MWGYWVAAGGVSFLIAAIAVGREARRLDAFSPRIAYQIDQAVQFVSESLPGSIQSRLSYGELEQLLVGHLNWMHLQGLMPGNITDLPQGDLEKLVLTEDVFAAYMLGLAGEIGVFDLEDVDIVRVAECHLSYFEAIGAVGPTVDTGL